MKVQLLGTGVPVPNPARYQTAILVTIGDDLLLFDAGRGAVQQMARANVNIRRVNPVFITHHHVDHIHNLFDVIITTAMEGRSEALKIFGPAGTKTIVDALINTIYASDIRFRVEEAKSIRKYGGNLDEQPEAIAAVDTQDIEPGVIWETDRWKASAEYVEHGDFSYLPDFDWRCLGYRIEAEGKVLTISGDTILCDGIIRLAQDADVLIQCCYMAGAQATTPETEYLTRYILPSSAQVGKIAAQARVQRMILTHFSRRVREKHHQIMLDEVRQDFAGEVILGQDLMVFEV